MWKIRTSRYQTFGPLAFCLSPKRLFNQNDARGKIPLNFAPVEPGEQQGVMGE
jgi:hypothetical protein